MIELLDGITFTDKVRLGTDSPNPFFPIIMLTGYTDRLRVFRARDASVTEYMATPISPKSLYARISAVVDRPRPLGVPKTISDQTVDVGSLNSTAQIGEHLNLNLLKVTGHTRVSLQVELRCSDVRHWRPGGGRVRYGQGVHKWRLTIPKWQ